MAISPRVGEEPPTPAPSTFEPTRTTPSKAAEDQLRDDRPQKRSTPADESGPPGCPKAGKNITSGVARTKTKAEAAAITSFIASQSKSNRPPSRPRKTQHQHHSGQEPAATLHRDLFGCGAGRAAADVDLRADVQRQADVLSALPL